MAMLLRFVAAIAAQLVNREMAERHWSLNKINPDLLSDDNHETFLRHCRHHSDGNPSPSRNRNEGPKSPYGEALLRRRASTPWPSSSWIIFGTLLWHWSLRRSITAWRRMRIGHSEPSKRWMNHLNNADSSNNLIEIIFCICSHRTVTDGIRNT